tara:strand:+ start:137 stop:679 length:543 start_codon:yes stop_codon:yes gene_type:complete
MASKVKVDQLETLDGTGTIALQNQLSGMTTVSLPALGAAQMPTGSVLQVVNGSFASETTSTSSSYADTGLTLAITPTSATSKILVLVNITGCFSSATNNYMVLRLMRDDSSLINIETQALYKAAATQATTSGTGATHLDSPSTTSATTYKVQFNNVTATGSVYICSGNATSTITLMEIAG